MTDQEMDARLRGAGERWRAADGADTATVELPPPVDELTGPRSHGHRPWLLAAAAAAVVALVAGGALALRGTQHNAPSAELAGLVGNVWLLTSPTSNASFYIDRQGSLVADDECQVSGGTATVSGSSLTVTHLVTRYKSCVDGGFAPSFSALGLKIVRGPATFSIDQHGLTISRRGVGELHLVPPTTPIPPPTLDIPTLTDTNWVNVSQRGPRLDTLHIVDDGTISSPCTSGRAVLNGALSITGCPGYNGTWAWSVSGTTLRLKHGRSVEVFTWRPDDPSAFEPAQLTGRTWHLESVAGVAAASSATFRIDGNIATYQGGCRTQRAQVRVQRGTFALVSHAAGPSCGSAGSQVATIDSFLTNSPASWAVRQGKLIVYGGGAQAFALVYGTGTTIAADLSGTWNLTKIVDRTQRQSPVTARAQLVIDKKNVSGTDGCRSFRGTVTTRDDTAAFSVTMPEPACSSSIEKTAGLVDRMLGGRVTYRIGLTSLVLTRAGTGEFTFTKSTTNDGDPAALLHKTWQLDTITFGDDIYRTGAPTADNGWLTFTEHGYTVYHTCYTVRGDAQRDSGTVRFTGGHTTSEHSCPPASNGRARAEASQAIDAILGPQTRWTQNGSMLTIESNDGTLAFHDVTSLSGTRWQLISVLSGPNRTSALGGLLLSFPDDHTLSLKGCNTSEASVEILIGSMSITGLHLTTRLPCPSSTPEDSPAGVLVEKLLKGSARWSITGDQLTLTSGTVSATFTMAPSASLGLTRSHWTATSIRRGAEPKAPVSTTNTERFDFAGGEFASKFMGAPVTVVGSMIAFGGWEDLAVVSNARMDQSDTTFVQTKLLVGPVKWSIDGDTLTLTKPGVGALTLTRS